MSSLFEALSRDIRRVGVKVVLIGLLGFSVALPATYLAIFAFERIDAIPRGVSDPERRMSHIQVVDPHRSVIYDITDTSIHGINTPGLKVLLSRMREAADITIVSGIDSFGSDHKYLSQFRDQDGIIVIGKHPELSKFDIQSDAINLWPGKNVDVASIRQSRIGGVPIVMHEEQAPSLDYSYGGWSRDSGSATLYVLDAETAKFLFESSTMSPVDVLPMLTCYCDVRDLQGVVDEMNAAERSSSTGRFYAAADSKQVLGVESLDSISDMTWTVVFSISVVGCYIGFVLSRAHNLWETQAGALRIERLCGARRFTLHLRFQAQILVAFTLPLLAAYHLVNTFVGASGFPPPIPSEATHVVVAAVCVAHLVATLPAIVGIERMCNYSNGLLR